MDKVLHYLSESTNTTLLQVKTVKAGFYLSENTKAHAFKST